MRKLFCSLVFILLVVFTARPQGVAMRWDSFSATNGIFYGSKTITWGNIFVTNLYGVKTKFGTGYYGWYAPYASNNTGGGELGNMQWVIWKQIGGTNFVQLNDPGFCQNVLAPIPTTNPTWTIGSGTNDQDSSTTVALCYQTIPGTHFIIEQEPYVFSPTNNEAPFMFFATTNRVAIVTNKAAVSRVDVGIRYVNKNGDDNNDGLSVDQAFFTPNRAMPYQVFTNGVSQTIIGPGTYEAFLNVSNTTVTGSGMGQTFLYNPGFGTDVVLGGINSVYSEMTVLGDLYLDATVGRNSKFQNIEVPQEAGSIDVIVGGLVMGELKFVGCNFFTSFDTFHVMHGESSGTLIFKNCIIQAKNVPLANNRVQAFQLRGTNSTWIVDNCLIVLSNNFAAGALTPNVVFEVGHPGIKLFLGGNTIITNDCTNAVMFATPPGVGNAEQMCSVFSVDTAQTIVSPSTVSSNSTAVYSLTATLTNVMGQGQITIDRAGMYLIGGSVNLLLNGATFAAVRTNAFTLQRTNNTPGAIGTTIRTVDAIVTTATGSAGVVTIPPFIYTTANTNDVVSIYGNVSTAPSAGSLDVVSANLTVIPLRIGP